MNKADKKSLVLLGIDPGYDRCGWAVGELVDRKLQLLGFGCITSTKKLERFDRYKELLAQLDAVTEKYHPDELAIETLFFAHNKNTAFAVAEVRGMILARAFSAHCEAFEYNPSTIKSSYTGNGHADKRAIKRMTQLLFKIETASILDDTLDAIAVLATHALSQHRGIL